MSNPSNNSIGTGVPEAGTDADHDGAPDQSEREFANDGQPARSGAMDVPPDEGPAQEDEADAVRTPRGEALPPDAR